MSAAKQWGTSPRDERGAQMVSALWAVAAWSEEDRVALLASRIQGKTGMSEADARRGAWRMLPTRAAVVDMMVILAGGVIGADTDPTTLCHLARKAQRRLAAP